MLKKLLKLILQYIRKLDKQLFVLVCGVSAFSVLLLYSMVHNDVAGKPSMYKIQFVCLCAGAAIALVMSALDYHKFTKLWFLYVPGAVGLTLLTFTPLAYKPAENADDVAWIDLGFTTLQPSEFLKIAFIMSCSVCMERSQR